MGVFARAAANSVILQIDICTYVQRVLALPYREAEAERENASRTGGAFRRAGRDAMAPVRTRAPQTAFPRPPGDGDVSGGVFGGKDGER